MTAEAYIADAELEKQITALQEQQDPNFQGKTLALLTVLLSRCSESNFGTVAGCVPTLTALAGSTDPLVQVSLWYPQITYRLAAAAWYGRVLDMKG